MTAILVSVISLIAFIEMAVIAVRAWSDGDAIRADEVVLTLPMAESRDDLTELAPDNVGVIHIGRRDGNPAPEREFVERLARELEPAGSPWRVEPGSSVAISQAVRDASMAWGVGAGAPYRPKHYRRGETTVEFAAIVARLASEETTEIGMRAAA